MDNGHIIILIGYSSKYGTVSFIEHLCARCCLRCFTYIISHQSVNAYFYLHRLDEEIEAQKAKLTCSRSQL